MTLLARSRARAALRTLVGPVVTALTVLSISAGVMQAQISCQDESRMTGAVDLLILVQRVAPQQAAPSRAAFGTAVPRAVASVEGVALPQPDQPECEPSEEEEGALPYPKEFGIVFEHQPSYLNAPVVFTGHAMLQGTGSMSGAQYAATATSTGSDLCVLSIRMTPVEALLFEVFDVVNLSDVTIIGCAQQQ